MIGALIKQGAADWQIFQQQNGCAQISLSGEWEHKDASIENAQVYVCVKKEDTGEPIIWWMPCVMHGKQWSVTLTLPTGGLYFIETCLTLDSSGWSEWAIRGDIVSHIGVGDLYVIAGQSNSAGYGKDYIYDPCELGVHIMKNDSRWHLASHPLQDSTGAESCPINMDEGNTGHSLYLSFAKYLKRELNYPIGLIQAAKGGSYIEQWAPGSGELYENMMERIRAAGGSVKGIVWYQGCSDAREDLCQSYYGKYIAFQKAVRGELQDLKLPFYVFQLNRCYKGKTKTSDYAWGMIREQQRRMGELENVYVIPTIDGVLSDGWGHNSAKANIVLGERLAKIVLSHRHHRHSLCDAPNISHAAQVGDKEILLTFDHVYDKLETFGCSPEKLAFTVEDDNGVVKLEGYEASGKEKILLRLGRSLRGDAKIHCAFEQDMQRIVPVDFATHLPLLPFYNVVVAQKEKDI